MFKKISAVMLLAACLAIGGARISQAGSIMENDVIRIGTEGTYPPFEFYDDNHNLVGFDIDISKAIIEKLGKRAEVVDMAFDGLIPALLTRKIDLIAAAMNATTERRKRVDFSNVYQTPDAVLLTKTENTAIKGVGDLGGKTIGVQLGTVEDIYLSESKLSIEIKRYQKTDDAVREVLLDRNDGVLLDTPVGNSYLASDRFKGYLKVAFKETIMAEEEGFAFAIRKGDPEFLNAFNAALEEIKNSGELQKIKEKYNLE
jgi:polar amino acid transport system substrate-binding protein